MIVKYKKSLNMPRGKIIAQASHALSSLVLGCFDFKTGQFRANSLEELKACVQDVQLQAVEDNDFDNSEFLVTIEDHGRTVFKGVPTVTCGLVINKDLAAKLGYSPNFYEESTEDEIQTRLVQVVDKMFARKDFDAAMRRCVALQSLHLIDFMQKPEFVASEDFRKWATGSFAKIVLVGKDNFLTELKEKNLFLDISWDGLDSCVIGPLRKETVSDHTNSLKMM